MSYALEAANSAASSTHDEDASPTPPLDPTMAVACKAELAYAASFHLNSTVAAYGLMIPEQVSMPYYARVQM